MTSTVNVPTPLVSPGCSCCAASSLCLAALHSVHHLLTVSIPDTGAAQALADLALQSPCASLAHQGRTKPPLLVALPPSWVTAHNTGPLWKQRTKSALCCPVLTTEGGVEPSGTSHPNGGTWGHPPSQGHLPQVYSELLREAQHTLHG